MRPLEHFELSRVNAGIVAEFAGVSLSFVLGFCEGLIVDAQHLPLIGGLTGGCLGSLTWFVFSPKVYQTFPLYILPILSCGIMAYFAYSLAQNLNDTL